jgi:hypothetical protein
MDRRRMLALTAGAGALALAGCTGRGNDGAGGGTDTPTTTPATRIVDSSVTTLGADCLSGEPTATVATDRDAGRVVVTGLIEAPTPCHEATLEATHDGDAGRLTVDVGVKQTAVECIECVGGIDYRVTVSFEGSAPGEVAVTHGGRPVASGAGGTASAGDGG